MTDDPWHYWSDDPPFRRHKRVEIVRPVGGQDLNDCEPEVITLTEIRPEWNIFGVYWRPLY
jgi:hypothetical protein